MFEREDLTTGNPHKNMVMASPTSGLSIKSDGKPNHTIPSSVVKGISNESRL